MNDQSAAKSFTAFEIDGIAKAASKTSAPAVIAWAPSAKALLTCHTFLKEAAKILLDEPSTAIASANWPITTSESMFKFSIRL